MRQLALLIRIGYNCRWPVISIMLNDEDVRKLDRSAGTTVCVKSLFDGNYGLQLNYVHGNKFLLAIFNTVLQISLNCSAFYHKASSRLISNLIAVTVFLLYFQFIHKFSKWIFLLRKGKKIKCFKHFPLLVKSMTEI